MKCRVVNNTLTKLVAVLLSDTDSQSSEFTVDENSGKVSLKTQVKASGHQLHEYI